MKLKRLFGLTVFGAASITLASCGESYDFKGADYRLVTTALAEDLSSISTSLSSDFLILNQIGEGLTRKDATDQVAYTTSDELNYTFQEGLAQSAVKVKNANGTITWTFTIREGVEWANGDTLTAEDFVFAWQRVVDPASAAAYASMMDIIQNGAAIRGASEEGTDHELYGDYEQLGVEATNSSTLVVTLNEEVPYFLSLMSFASFYPVHQATYNASLPSSGNHAEARYGKSISNSMAIGPFELAYWDTDDGIALQKNENYWDEEAVEIDTISMKLVKSTDAALLYYEQGNCDRVGVTGQAYEDNVNNSELTIETAAVTWYMALNLNNTYTANPDIRAALAAVVNKSDAAGTLAPYVPVDWFVPDGLGAIDVDGETEDFRTYANAYNGTPTYDASNAQDLLNAGLSTVGATSIGLDFLVFDAESWQDIFKSIYDDFNSLDNLSVNLSKKPSADVYSTYDNNNGPKVEGLNKDSSSTTQIVTGTGTEWEIGWYGWGPDYNDPTTFLDLYKSTDSHNIIGLDDLTKYDTSMVSGTDYKNWDVTGTGMTAAQASAHYDQLLVDANTALQELDYTGYYNNLAAAEAFLLDNNFLIPVAQKAGGILENGRVEGNVTHVDGADYTWKWVKVVGE